MALLTVSEFAAEQKEQGGKFGTPQKVNYAIRKQDAPYTKDGGKRMIDPEAWSDWEQSNPQATQTRRSKAGGDEVNAGTQAARIAKKTGVQTGEMMMWKSGQNDEKVSAGKVENTNDYFAGVQIDSCSINAPLQWDSIEKYFEDGKMTIVNHPEELLWVLAQHYKGEKEEDTAEQLKALYERHKTHEAMI